MLRALSREMPVRVGTATFFTSGPVLMTSWTRSPGLTLAPLTGLLEMTLPSSTVSEACFVAVSTFRSIC